MGDVQLNNVDEYINGFPEHVQCCLKQIRTTIRTLVPEAKETISYGMPAFTLNGRGLIYFGAFKKHIGMYPVPTGNSTFEHEFSDYKTSGKGTIQFPYNKPMPLDLIEKIVKYRIHH